MKGTRIAGVALAIACAMLLASCGQAQRPQNGAQEPATTSEGADTKIAVTYDGQAGLAGARFLKDGDRVAVISPSALPTREQVDAVVEGLEGWGYEPVEGEHVVQQGRTLDDCLADLVWALEDDSVDAVFCVRGGYGASEVADALPAGLVVKAGKPVIGYSDVTALHSAWAGAGVPSFHACMSGAFADDFPAECAEAERRMLKGEVPAYACEGTSPGKPGEADGVLVGGNLSTFTSVLGTAYDCTEAGGPYILFLEDVGEDVQHVHRYLAVLKHLGVLDRAAGIVFGEWTDVPADMDDYDGSSRGGAFASMSDMIARQYLGDLECPVAFGFPAGHGDANYPLLMGAEAHLDVAEGGYTLSWS